MIKQDISHIELLAPQEGYENVTVTSRILMSNTTTVKLNNINTISYFQITSARSEKILFKDALYTTKSIHTIDLHAIVYIQYKLK